MIFILHYSKQPINNLVKESNHLNKMLCIRIGEEMKSLIPLLGKAPISITLLDMRISNIMAKVQESTRLITLPISLTNKGLILFREENCHHLLPESSNPQNL